jgi:hypothetical protein
VRRWAANLFDVLAKDSLLLCVPAVGVWVWSYSREPSVAYEDITSGANVVVSRGKLGALQSRQIGTSVPDYYFAPHWTLTARRTADLFEEVGPEFPYAHPRSAGSSWATGWRTTSTCQWSSSPWP